VTLDSSGALILERHYFAAATATCYPSEQKQLVRWRQNCNLNGLGSAAESQNSDLSPSRDRMRVRWAQTSEITKSMWSTCCFFTYTNYCWYPFDAADLFAASPLFLFFPTLRREGATSLPRKREESSMGRWGLSPNRCQWGPARDWRRVAAGAIRPHFERTPLRLGIEKARS